MNGTATRQAPASPAAEWNAARENSYGALPFATEAPPYRKETESIWSGKARQVTFVAADFAFVCISGAAAFWLYFVFTNSAHVSIRWFQTSSNPVLTQAFPGFVVLYGGLTVLACMSQNLYNSLRLRAIEETWAVAKAVGLATALLALFIFASGHEEVSQVIVGSAGACGVATLAGWRYAKRRYVLRQVERGEGVSRVLIVGAGKMGQALASWLEKNRQLGLVVCGFLDTHVNGDARVLGSVRDLRRVAIEHFIDQLFVTLPADRDLVKEIFLEARQLRLNLNVVPDLYDGIAWRAPVQSIGGFPTIELHGQPIPVLGLAIKRAIDLIGASLGLVATFPLLLIAAIWIRFDSAGSIIYSAERVGRKGKRFRCYKLRTMVAEADAHKDQLRQTNERQGPFFKMENDPRVTRSGKWLRKYSVDELPQLVNVLLGDMSLVGPRPHPVDDFKLYSLEHLRRLDVKPGVTGLWQVTARRDPSFEANMLLDLEYIEKWSLRLDLRILARTFPVVLEGAGA